MEVATTNMTTVVATQCSVVVPLLCSISFRTRFGRGTRYSLPQVGCGVSFDRSELSGAGLLSFHAIESATSRRVG